MFFTPRPGAARAQSKPSGWLVHSSVAGRLKGILWVRTASGRGPSTRPTRLPDRHVGVKTPGTARL